MAQTSFRILDGPSKFDLMVALFVGHRDSQICMQFKCEDAEGHQRGRLVRITALERRDAWGDRWRFRGYITKFDNVVHPEEGKVKGCFSTRTRKGALEIKLLKIEK